MNTTYSALAEMYGPKELSELLKIPEPTLTHWRYQGIGPAYLKVGKHVRYRESDVTAWLEAQRVETKSA